MSTRTHVSVEVLHSMGVLSINVLTMDSATFVRLADSFGIEYKQMTKEVVFTVCLYEPLSRNVKYWPVSVAWFNLLSRYKLLIILLIMKFLLFMILMTISTICKTQGQYMYVGCIDLVFFKAQISEILILIDHCLKKKTVLLLMT